MCGKLNIKSDILDKKGITQDIYVLIFLIFISRKLQLSSIEYCSCDRSPNQLQSRRVSPCIVTHLRALLLHMSSDGAAEYVARETLVPGARGARGGDCAGATSRVSVLHVAGRRTTGNISAQNRRCAISVTSADEERNKCIYLYSITYCI